MQCSKCKRWYTWALTAQSPHGYGCSAQVDQNTQWLVGSYGSVVLDGVSAKITLPHNFAPGAVICDFCYLRGVKECVFSSLDDDGDDDGGERISISKAMRDDDTICVFCPFRNFFSLLCSFECGWVFYVTLRGGDEFGEFFEFRCVGFPEQSDVECNEELMENPKVLELRDSLRDSMRAAIQQSKATAETKIK